MSAPMETIVVGVDGSDGGAAALEFAAGEAAFRGAQLRIVSAWEIPVAVYGAEFAPPPDAVMLDSFRVGAEQVAEEALALLEVDEAGLERFDRDLLRCVVDKFGGGPVGLSTLAVALGEEPETIEDVYEPFLLQLGFL